LPTQGGAALALGWYIAGPLGLAKVWEAPVASRSASAAAT